MYLKKKRLKLSFAFRYIIDRSDGDRDEFITTHKMTDILNSYSNSYFIFNIQIQRQLICACLHNGNSVKRPRDLFFSAYIFMVSLYSLNTTLSIFSLYCKETNSDLDFFLLFYWKTIPLKTPCVFL